MNVESQNISIPRKNPFKPGRFITDPRLFSGRDDLLEEAYNYIYNHNSIFIVGDRGIGKTSFFIQLEAIVKKDKIALERFKFANKIDNWDTTFIKHRCKKRQGLKDIILELIDKIEKKISIKHSGAESEVKKWKFSFKFISHEIERTYSKKKNQKENIAGYVEDFISFIKNIYKRFPHLKKSGICFVIDELEFAVQNNDIGSFLKIAIDDLQESKIENINFIFIGLNEALHSLKISHPSADRYFFEIKVPRMNEKEVIGLIDRTLKNTGLIFPPKVVKSVNKLSFGYPYLVQLLGYELYFIALQIGQHPGMRDLEGVIKRVTQKLNNYVYLDKYSSIPDKESEDILMTLAKSKNDFLSYYDISERSDIDIEVCKKKCDNLQKLGFLHQKRFGIYEFKNPLFAAFLYFMDFDYSWNRAKEGVLIGMGILEERRGKQKKIMMEKKMEKQKAEEEDGRMADYLLKKSRKGKPTEQIISDILFNYITSDTFFIENPDYKKI